LYFDIFQGIEVVRPSLELLRSKEDLVRHPVWANADIVEGPGSSSDPIDPKEYVMWILLWFHCFTAIAFSFQIPCHRQ
jgi:hypothetical protein